MYFLALNLVPCGDSVPSEDDNQIVSVVDYNGDQDQDCELCSPFCQCHCCHVHTIDIGLDDFQPLQTIFSQEIFAHIDNPGKDFTLSLYQPPQV